MDLRSEIRSAVLGRRPVDGRERDSIAAFVTAFDGLADPFSETANRVHVTASALVTGRRGVLLHKHKRLGLWLQPGGHIDAGEAPWDAARRETAEETGLAAEPVGEPAALAHVDVHPGPRGHTHLDLRYHLDAGEGAPAPPHGESQDVAWFPWRRAIAVAEPGLEGALRALQPGTATVRQVRSSDATDCAAVYLRSRAFALPTVPVVHAPGEVRRWMADEVIGRSDVWVAEVDGVITGLMVLDHGWIEQLYVDPAWLGRGLGDRFLDIARQRAGGAGLQLWTFQVNEPAVRFYARHGFVEAERTDGAGNEERSPDVRLVWPGP